MFIQVLVVFSLVGSLSWGPCWIPCFLVGVLVGQFFPTLSHLGGSCGTILSNSFPLARLLRVNCFQLFPLAGILAEEQYLLAEVLAGIILSTLSLKRCSK